MLHVLQPEDGSRIVDLGAGYARMAWVIGRHYPRVQFTGIELVQERVQESLRCLALRPFPNVTMLQGDLSAPTFLLPVADSYFMYDFGSRMAIQAVLNKLRSIASERRVTVIGRGRSSRDAIEREHPWLSQIVPPVHCGNFSIYRSHDSPKIRP
jgi:precorrin-6B methylase 2